MQISKLDRTNFMAGNVKLQRVYPHKIGSFDAIKNIAEDRNIDILISKNKKSKYLPKEDMYMVMASKDIPIMDRNFFPIGYKYESARSCIITANKVSKEELSVKIYNAVMSAIESLNKKL